jgi:hypothetical protein
VLNKAEPLPFHAHENPGEETRLKYRYLDLRRPEMQRMMRTRIKLVQALRRWLDARGFQDIETPILTKATPEGARDFLVPARMHPGEFYALPQSPQLFKQILMVAASTATTRSRAASATRPCAPTASWNSPSSTWSSPGSASATCRTRPRHDPRRSSAR